MNAKSKFSISVATLTLMISQSGCLLGAASAPVLFPLEFTDSELAPSSIIEKGYIYSLMGVVYNDVGTLSGGTLLGEEGRGYADGLNELPCDTQLADRLGVSIADIQIYNNNLNHVQEIVRMMKDDIHDTVDYIKRKMIQTLGTFDYKHDPRVNRVAKKYGFENASQMIRTLRQKVATPEMLEQFAKSNAVNLTAPEARILLQLVFKVKFSDPMSDSKTDSKIDLDEQQKLGLES